MRIERAQLPDVRAGYAVELAKVANVAGGSTLAGFHPAHLARGTQKTLSHLFDGQAFCVAECAQQGAQFEAAKRRAVHFCHLGHLLPQE